MSRFLWRLLIGRRGIVEGREVVGKGYRRGEVGTERRQNGGKRGNGDADSFTALAYGICMNCFDG